MSLELDTIKAAYETLQLSPEQIAETQLLELTSVKAALMSCSSKYRKDIGITSVDNDESKKLDFTDEDLADSNQIILEAMRQAVTPEGLPDHKTRANIAQYVRDDKKGRKNPVKALGNSFNIFSFNESLRELRSTKQRLVTEVSSSLREA